ncbi:MAG: carboxypeptidase-like regulatory domain-containing protein, partial [Bacteroidia bacterium]
CKKDAATGPAGAQGPAGPSLTGNLKGYISTYDEFGGKILTNQAGDTVSIDGTTMKAITDSTGLYKFTGISTGQYTLSITKPGFGAGKIQNIQFVGGGDTYRDAKIAQPSTSNVLTLNDSIGPITGNVTVYGTMPTNVQGRTFIIYVGNSAVVNSSTANYLIFYTKNVNPGAVKVSFVIPKTDLYDAGFAVGSTAYIAAYGVGSLTASSYEDFTNGRTVFSTVSSTPAIVSLIVP